MDYFRILPPDGHSSNSRLHGEVKHKNTLWEIACLPFSTFFLSLVFLQRINESSGKRQIPFVCH
jgi:hypothetical protein